MWERSFVGVSVLLGAAAEDATGLLAVATPPSDLDARLRDGRRAVRAQALAVVAQEIAVELTEMTLR